MWWNGTSYDAASALAVAVVGHDRRPRRSAATRVLQRNSRSLRQWLNFETRISVRYGAAAAHSSQVMRTARATGGERRRAASRASAPGPSTANRTRMKNRPLGQVAVLLALHDVAAVLDEQAGDGVHDAGPVGAEQGQDERRRSRDRAVMAIGAYSDRVDHRLRQPRHVLCIRNTRCSYRRRMANEHRDGARHGPVRRPGADHPGDPGPTRRGRRHRDRRRARGAQEHRVPAGRDAGVATAWSSRTRTAASTASASACCGWPAPRPRGSTWCRRPRPICRKLAARLGGDRQHRGALRPLGALPRPGRRPVGAAVAQLGRPAHPAARHLQRQGAAERAVVRRGRQPAAAAAVVHRGHGDHSRPGCAASSPRSASRGTPSPSTSSRSG